MNEDAGFRSAAFVLMTLREVTIYFGTLLVYRDIYEGRMGWIR